MLFAFGKNKTKNILIWSYVCAIIISTNQKRMIMNNSQTYEKIVKKAFKGKHLIKTVILFLCYALFAAIWLIIAFNSASKIILVLVAGVLSTLFLVAITLKYVRLEYEYSFWYGGLSIAKIYAKKSRKAVIETEMKDLLMIAPATEENIARAEHFEIEGRVLAVSHEKEDNIWLAVTGGKDERRIIIFFEADERALGMLKAANPHAFVKKI